MAESGTTARRHDWSLLAIGAVFAGAGIYFILVALGLAASPSRLYGPDWLAFATGLVFLAGGVSVTVRGWLAVPDHQSNLPADAPAAAAAIQWLAALLIIVALASIGTWIAFGSGEREFGTNLPVQGSLRESIGRVAFGIGAVITWLMAAAVAYSGVKRILGKSRGTGRASG